MSSCAGKRTLWLLELPEFLCLFFLIWENRCSFNCGKTLVYSVDFISGSFQKANAVYRVLHSCETFALDFAGGRISRVLCLVL